MNKNIKRLLIMLMFIMIPIGVFAEDSSMLDEKLYDILGKDRKIKITDFKTLNPFDLDAVTQENDDEEPAYDMGFSRVISSYIYNLDEVKAFLKQYADENPTIDVFCKSYTNCGIGVIFDSDNRGDCTEDMTDEELDAMEYPACYMEHFDVEIEVLNNKNTEKYNELKELLGDSDYENHRKYYLYDLAYINQLYNYHNGNDSLIDRMSANPTVIAKNFPEINDILYKHNDFDLKYAMHANMGNGWTNVEYLASADFVSFYDNTAYLNHTFEFHIAPIILVSDKTEDDKLIEAATERIKNYINSDVKVTIEDVTATINPEPNENDEEDSPASLSEIMTDLDEVLGKLSLGKHDENTRVYRIKMGATLAPNYFFIIKADDSKIKDLEIKGIEKNTGIGFSTLGASLPIDSSMSANDVTNELKKNNSNILNAYDMNLYSETSESFIKNIAEGLKITIPVSNDFDASSKEIAYLDENGNVKEKYELNLVTVDGKKYASFVTNHLSVYGIVEQNDISVPELTIKKKGSKVVVSWLEDQNAEKFVVYRADKKDGKFTKLDTITKNSYTDKKVTYGKTYYYKVKAVGEDNQSATSEVVKFKVVPDKVQNVKVGSIKTTSVKVSFDKVSETGYVIERSTDNKKWEKVTTITKNSTVSYKDKKLKANKTYYYRVRAYKTVSGKKVYGKYSDVVSVKTAPAAPTFTVKENNYQSLKLKITSVKGAERYEVYRAAKKDGEFKKVADLDKEELKYTDNDLKLDKKYYYKVRACNVDNKCGDYSSVVNRKVALVTPKITLEGSKTVPMTIKMSKIDFTDGVQIYRAESKNGKYEKIKTIDSAFDTYIDESVKKNKTYYYKVRTFVMLNGKKYYSEYSSVKSLKNVYAPTSVNKLKAEKITDFNGVYKKGDVVLKAYAKNDEYVTVFSIEKMPGEENTSSNAQYDLEFNNGVLSTEFFGEKISVELTEKGIIFTDPDGKLKGEYEKESDYTLDDFYADMLGDEEYLTTKYNGVFESEKGDVLYIYQSDKESGRFDTELGNKSYGIGLEITDEKATGELFDDNFEIVVEDNVLTLKVYENEELTIEETFTRKADMTKEEIVEKFF